MIDLDKIHSSGKLTRLLTKIVHFFRKNIYDESFVKHASKIEETDNEFIITGYYFSTKLVSRYKKSDLTKEQIDYIKSDHKKFSLDTTFLV